MSQNPQFDFDFAVVGGGSGGYAAARTAVAYGLKTVVVEGGDELGGLCILRGCMPTKALLYASDVLHLARNSAIWGLKISKVGFDFAKVMARKELMIQDFAGYRSEQLKSGKFEFIRAFAKFLDPHTLGLSNGSTVTAKHILLSTGSTIAPSPLPHLREIGCLNSDTALSLKKLPKSLIVLGGGPVAVEFAQFFARFDVKVTLIQRGEHVLREFDLDASNVVEEVLRREGVEIFSCAKLIDAAKTRNLKTVSFRKGEELLHVEAEEILFALGRVPKTADLELEKAGVETSFGRIMANHQMQTTVPHIYAAGDCTGPYEIVHIAIQQGEIAAYNIAHPTQKRQMDYRLATSVVFTDPQVATVGLTEKLAATQNVPYLVSSYPFADHGKSLLMEAKDGFVKLLANPASGEIIGGACVGPWGGELIHEITAAMYKRMTVQELAAMPHYHPTLAEIWTYPAEDLAGRVGASETAS